jgi:HlyD family secretion protein
MAIVRRVVALLAIVGVVGAGGFALWRRLRPNSAQRVLYATARVTQGSIRAEVTGSATLQPAESVTLTAPAAGTVEQVSIHQGDTVQAGEVVAILTDPQLEESITQAKLRVHADLEALAAATGTSPSQAQDVNPEQGVTLTAPQAGRITEVDVAAGAPVTAGEVLAKIVDSGTVVMDVALVPYEKGLVADGAAVRVHFDAFAGWVQGRLQQISPNPVPSSTGTFEVYPAQVVLPNPGLLQPGDRGQVDVRDGSHWLPLPQEFTVTSFGHESDVHSPIDATAEEVAAIPNAWVQAGAPLFRLGGGAAAAAIASEQLALQQDEASLETLRQERAALTVRSPISGIVSSVDVTAGQAIGGGGTIASEYGPDQMTFTLPVSELQVSQVKNGQSVQITTPGLSGKTFTGKVTAVNTVGQSGNGLSTFDVTVAVDGGGELLPGMTADAEIITAQASNALLVPVEAVLQQQGGDEVEVVSGDQVTTVPVKVGLVNSDEAQILSGLSLGETVVTGAATGQIANAVTAVLAAKPQAGGGGRAPTGPNPQSGPPPAGK